MVIISDIKAVPDPVVGAMGIREGRTQVDARVGGAGSFPAPYEVRVN